MSKRSISLVAMAGFLVLAMLPALADSAVQPTFVAGDTDCSTVSSAPGGLSVTVIEPTQDGPLPPGPDGSVITLSNVGRRGFDFSTDGALVYDVVVKGSGSNWYDYDGPPLFHGPVRSDTDLEIPNGNKLNAIHFCYSGNAAPVATADAYSTNEDTPLSVAAPGVLANDTDANSDPLTAVLVSTASNGTLTLNPNGSFTYTPAANYNGPDEFSYKANDGFADSNTVNVTITVNAVNDAPVAAGDSYSTNEDTQLLVAAPGVLANDSDPDGDPLTVVLVSTASNGTLTLNLNGSFTYTPAANFNGSDEFTYTANDGLADSNVATVNITVTAVNDAPVAVDDTGQTVVDQAVDINVLANDTDIDSIGLTVTNLPTLTDQGGTAAVSSGGVTYTPATGFTGTDTFTYTANDGLADSNVATVTVTVFEGLLACGGDTGLVEDDGSDMSAQFFRHGTDCGPAKPFTVNFDPLAGANGEIEFLIDPAFDELSEYTAKLTFEPFSPVGNPNGQTFTWDLDAPGTLTAADWCVSATFIDGILIDADPPGTKNGCVASQLTQTVGTAGEAQTTWWVYFRFDLKTRG